MAKESKTTSASRMKAEQILLSEQSSRLAKLVKQHRAGDISTEMFLDMAGRVEATGKNLDEINRSRLRLKLEEAIDSAAVDENFARIARERPAVRIAAPDEARLAAARMVADRPLESARLRVLQEAEQAQRISRSQGTIPRIVQAASNVRVPGYLGSREATKVPAVADAITRLQAAKTPRQITSRGRDVFRIARGAQAAEAGKARLGKAGLAAGGLGLLGLIAGKAFGKKDEIDPAVQMMIAQRLGAAQEGDGGRDQSRQLIDLSRFVTILKNLQALAGMQGPAPRPRLI